MLRQIHIDIGFVNGIRWKELGSEREVRWSFEWHNVCAPKQTKGGLKIARWMSHGLDSAVPLFSRPTDLPAREIKESVE